MPVSRSGQFSDGPQLALVGKLALSVSRIMSLMETAPSLGQARVFFALWPDIDVRQALGNVANAYALPCVARAMSADRLHLTLLFMGEVERARLPALMQAASAVRARPFWLDIERLAFWQHNKIAYATVKHAALPLVDLVAALVKSMQAAGFTFAGGEFQPHITLLRNVQHRLEPQSIRPVRWRLDSFVLLESVLAGPEVRYQVIGQWPLALIDVGV
jgi:2'-5' RNA ligase